MCETYYCQECGCEIRHSMDIGIVGAELESRSVFPGCIKKEYFCKTVIICASCMDDADRMMERVANAPEMEVEAAFDAFCRQLDEDTNLREVCA